MINLTEKNLTRIREQKIECLASTPIEIYPFYTGLNLANIPTSICKWFNIPAPENIYLDIPEPPIETKQIKNIILLLIDGLPFKRMQDWLENGCQKNLSSPLWAKIKAEGLLTPLTSVAPSTTANALTSLWTGRMPAEHGVIGYELFLQELGITLNMILQVQVYPQINDPTPINPAFRDGFLPVPTFGGHFEKYGIQPFAFQEETLCNSGLSQMLLSDVQKVPFNSLHDMWQKVNALLDTSDSRRKYIYIYWGEIDTLSHHEGPNSPLVLQAWQLFNQTLQNFLSERMHSMKSDTLFLITSDHGQIPTLLDSRYDVRFDQEFMQMLEIPPSGESRFPYLFIKPTKIHICQEYIEQRWPGEFTLFPSEKLITSSLFGKKIMTPLIRSRLGNYAALPKGNAFWWWANKENRLLGRHGGFSKEEMIIPFFLLPL